MTDGGFRGVGLGRSVCWCLSGRAWIWFLVYFDEGVVVCFSELDVGIGEFWFCGLREVFVEDGC